MQSNQIDQINVNYHPTHDRLLMRVGLGGEREYRIWLTRRFVQVLWRGLRTALELAPDLRERADPDVRRELMAFKNEQALAQTTFTRHYNEQRTQPAAGQVILAAGLQIKTLDNDQNLLILSSKQGTSIQLSLDRMLLYSLCKLIHDACEKAEWGLGLALTDHQPGGASDAAGDVTIN